MYYFITALTILYDIFVLSCRLDALFLAFKPEQQQETQDPDILCIMYDVVIEHPVLTLLIMLFLSFLSLYMMERHLKQPEQYERSCKKEDIYL